MLFPSLIININCKVFLSVILSPINKQHVYWIDIMTGSIHTKRLQLMALRTCCCHLFDIVILFCFNAFSSPVRTCVRIFAYQMMKPSFLRGKVVLCSLFETSGQWMNMLCVVFAKKNRFHLCKKNRKKKYLWQQ